MDLTLKFFYFTFEYGVKHTLRYFFSILIIKLHFQRTLYPAFVSLGEK